MGDRITSYRDCPKCGGKGTFECYEALSSEMKLDCCEKCGHTINYTFQEVNGVICITKVNDLASTNSEPEQTNTKSANPSDNLNKVVEEIMLMIPVRRGDDVAEMKHAQIRTAILELINNEKIAWEKKPVGDAIEIDVPAKTMQFVMSKIKLKPKTIASRTLTPEWVVELWLIGKSDKYDLQVYIWKLKILASLTHRYNWAIFLLKPENLPTKATLKKGEK